MTITKKTICIIASVLICFGAFLPYISTSVFGTPVSKSLVDGGDGYILLVIAAIALICSCTEKYILNIILGIISFGIFILENGSITSSMNDMDRTSAAIVRSVIQNGAGYYCLVIGSVALIVFSILGHSEKRKQKQASESDNPPSL